MSVVSVYRGMIVVGLVVIATVLAIRETRAQSVTLACNVSMSSIAFGSYDTLPGSTVSSNSTLSVSCLNVTLTTGNLYVCVALPSRSMTGSSTSAALAYDIYGPSPSTASWSNTTAIVIPLASLRLLQTYTMNVQAAILGSQQSKPPDSYTQTLASSATYGTTSCTSGLLSGSTTFSFQATATILKSCNVSAVDLSFGAVGDLNTVVDGQSTVSVRCSKSTGYVIGLDGGLTGAANPAARKMRFGTDSITYGLYQNSNRSSPWSSTSTVAGTGTAATQSIPVYGRVPVQATPSIGTYSDTIVVTVTF